MLPPQRSSLRAVIVALRPTHWIKNAFVLAPLIFSGQFVWASSWWRALMATAGFCLLSSATYLFNDIVDRNYDRQHEEKRNRPIASGEVSVAAAGLLAALLAAMGLILAALPAMGLDAPWALPGTFIFAGGYLLLNVMYSLWLKHHTIIDVLAVASGFVLRAGGGAAAIAVPISPWLVVCTFMLCLFLAVTKRRVEHQLYDQNAGALTRPALKGYTSEELDRLLTVSAALAIMTYSLYCLAPSTIAHVGSGHLIWTIPLVMYGVFRYERLSRRMILGDVVEILMRDRVIWIVVILFALLCALIIAVGRRGAIAAILAIG
ncbi:MAG: UbiA prenyltransferase family protein [Planctomycetaceae bacterium]|nr:UbiA prenyltransferase family protein [Planctomycetaceae bacterium]